MTFLVNGKGSLAGPTSLLRLVAPCPRMTIPSFPLTFFTSLTSTPRPLTPLTPPLANGMMARRGFQRERVIPPLVLVAPPLFHVTTPPRTVDTPLHLCPAPVAPPIPAAVAMSFHAAVAKFLRLVNTPLRPVTTPPLPFPAPVAMPFPAPEAPPLAHVPGNRATRGWSCWGRSPPPRGKERGGGGVQ